MELTLEVVVELILFGIVGLSIGFAAVVTNMSGAAVGFAAVVLFVAILSAE